MEPAGPVPKVAPPTCKLVTDADRINTYTGWLDNEAARRALDLYALASRIAGGETAAPAPRPKYYVLLVPQGNHAAVGFRMQTDSGTDDHLQQPFIKLDPLQRSFDTTLLHETGHIVLATLGVSREDAPLSSIPHSTSTLSDRGTAFDEGFAIHLETMAAHFAEEPALRSRYRHERVDFGPEQKKRSEYFRGALDVMTYSQDLARYYEVRENSYAFAPAYRGPDYLRVQLEKNRDFAVLRDANQLLQSEGFYASFLYSCVVRGPQSPDAETVRSRYEQILTALAEMSRANKAKPDTPFLLDFVATYLKTRPADAGEIVDVLLDLSHGVFVDAGAAELWQRLYLGALRLDLQQLPVDEIQAARARWHDAICEDPQILYSRLGPQIACAVPARKVQLVMLGEEQPVQFDINTVPEGILRMIPGISEDEVARWQTQRSSTPFADLNDFDRRVTLSQPVRAQLRF
jgi:hypothetical protein